MGKKLDAVFEGGGVKGIGLAGALLEVEKAGYEFQNVAGTSAGAIIATLVSAGYTAAEIKPIIMNLDFSKFMDAPLLGHIPIAGPIIDILGQMGLYEGDYFLSLMRDLLARKDIHTFGDLLMPGVTDDRYRFKVRMIVSDVTDGRMLVLPQDIAKFGLKPEELDVALAVRMSMSIPFFFRPVQQKDGENHTHMMVDGGLLSNYPVWLFDSDDSQGPPSWPTFGFKLVRAPQQGGQITAAGNDVHGPISLFMALASTAMSAHDMHYIETHDFARTIAIDTGDVSSFDFNLSNDTKKKLFSAGQDAARDFLSRWDFDTYVKTYRTGQPEPTRRELATGKPLATHV